MLEEKKTRTKPINLNKLLVLLLLLAMPTPTRARHSAPQGLTKKLPKSTPDHPYDKDSKTSVSAHSDLLRRAEADLLNAAKAGNYIKLKQLLEKGGDPNVKSKTGKSALELAITGGKDCVACVKVLIRYGADLAGIEVPKGAAGEYIWQCLEVNQAVVENNYSQLASRLASGAFVDGVVGQLTPLARAVTADKPRLAKELLARGADPNFMCKGYPLLVYAIKNKSLEMVRELLKNKADVNQTSTIATMAYQESLPILEELLAHGLDINCRDANGHTLLFKAVMAADIEKTRFLIANKADLNLKYTHDDNQVDLLYMILGTIQYYRVSGELEKEKQYMEIFKIFLAADPDINAQEKNDGYTPLMIAAKYNLLPEAELLLARKADVSIASNVGEKPVDIAMKTGNIDLADLIIKSDQYPKQIELVSTSEGAVVVTEPVPRPPEELKPVLKEDAEIPKKEDFFSVLPNPADKDFVSEKQTQNNFAGGGVYLTLAVCGLAIAAMMLKDKNDFNARKNKMAARVARLNQELQGELAQLSPFLASQDSGLARNAERFNKGISKQIDEEITPINAKIKLAKSDDDLQAAEKVLDKFLISKNEINERIQQFIVENTRRDKKESKPVRSYEEQLSQAKSEILSMQQEMQQLPPQLIEEIKLSAEKIKQKLAKALTNCGKLEKSSSEEGLRSLTQNLQTLQQEISALHSKEKIRAQIDDARKSFKKMLWEVYKIDCREKKTFNKEDMVIAIAEVLNGAMRESLTSDAAGKAGVLLGQIRLRQAELIELRADLADLTIDSEQTTLDAIKQKLAIYKSDAALQLMEDINQAISACYKRSAPGGDSLPKDKVGLAVFPRLGEEKEKEVVAAQVEPPKKSRPIKKPEKKEKILTPKLKKEKLKTKPSSAPRVSPLAENIDYAVDILNAIQETVTKASGDFYRLYPEMSKHAMLGAMLFICRGIKLYLTHNLVGKVLANIDHHLAHYRGVMDWHSADAIAKMFPIFCKHVGMLQTRNSLAFSEAMREKDNPDYNELLALLVGDTPQEKTPSKAEGAITELLKSFSEADKEMKAVRPYTAEIWLINALAVYYLYAITNDKRNEKEFKQRHLTLPSLGEYRIDSDEYKFKQQHPGAPVTLSAIRQYGSQLRHDLNLLKILSEQYNTRRLSEHSSSHHVTGTAAEYSVSSMAAMVSTVAKHTKSPYVARAATQTPSLSNDASSSLAQRKNN